MMWWTAYFFSPSSSAWRNIYAPNAEKALWLAENHATILGIYWYRPTIIIEPAYVQGPSITSMAVKVPNERI